MTLHRVTFLTNVFHGFCRVTPPLTPNRVFSSCPQMKRNEFGTGELLQSKRPRVEMETARIKLSSQERRLRGLLLAVARYIDESKEIKEKIELRFAGGWVRDKLLGMPSHDIDTAINAMTGSAFSDKLQEYLKNKENMKKHALEAKDMRDFHKIQANPEKSKHLATATTKLFGFDVDFVNLRKETYSKDSRNPQMEFGTAEEDALRRDATINALFYNLHTDLVEDFTSGIEDLAACRIRTPLEPKTTFLDDPLRVLRLIRFASRLGFSIDPASEASMSDPAVMEALKLKISRERVGIELEKMLKGNDPMGSLHLIDRLGLYSVIFTDPKTQEILEPETNNWAIAYTCLNELKSNDTAGSIYNTLVRSIEAKYLSWVLAAITPWSQMPLPQPDKPGGKLPPPLGSMVIREGLKGEKKICNFVAWSLRHHEDITALKDAIVQKMAYTSERDTIGMAICQWDAEGGHWRLQVLFALLVEAVNRDSKSYGNLFHEWQQFIDHLEAMEIMDGPAERKILDGKLLCAELGGVKPGKWMGHALRVVTEWQFRNPGITDYKGAVEEVRKRAKELNIPLP